jgi:hypothetical protein
VGQPARNNIPNIPYTRWGSMKVASDKETEKENNLFEMKDYNDRNKL